MARTKTFPVPMSQAPGVEYRAAYRQVWLASQPRPLAFTTSSRTWQLSGNMCGDGHFGFTIHPGFVNLPFLEMSGDVGDFCFSPNGRMAVCVTFRGDKFRFRWMDVGTGLALVPDVTHTIAEDVECSGLYACDVPGMALLHTSPKYSTPPYPSSTASTAIITPSGIHFVPYNRLCGKTLSPDGRYFFTGEYESEPLGAAPSSVRVFDLAVGCTEIAAIDVRRIGTWIHFALTPGGCSILALSAPIPRWSPPEKHRNIVISGDCKRIAYSINLSTVDGIRQSLTRVVVRDFEHGHFLMERSFFNADVSALSFSPPENGARGCKWLHILTNSAYSWRITSEKFV